MKVELVVWKENLGSIKRDILSREMSFKNFLIRFLNSRDRLY